MELAVCWADVKLDDVLALVEDEAELVFVLVEGEVELVLVLELLDRVDEEVAVGLLVVF